MDRDYITNHLLPLPPPPPPENIFNAGEFGFFYQYLPNKTLHSKGEKCSDRKHSKVRLTGLAAGNTSGERLQMFVKCLSLESLLNHDVLKVLKLCLANTMLTIKVGCLESFLKIGYMILIKEKDSLNHR